MASPLEQGSFTVTISFDSANAFKVAPEDISECYFIEDIYTMTMLGKLCVKDRYGIREYGPLTGDERMTISYGNASLITKEFSIYNIPAVENIVDFRQQQNSIISVLFCDTYYTNLTQKKFSKSWDKDTQWSQIINDIFKNMLKIPDGAANIEASNDKTLAPFYIPSWNVANTMRYIMDRITGTTGKYGYLCYPNSEKLINCVTLDGLLKNAPMDSQVYLFNTDDMSYENKILGWDTMGVNQTGLKEVGGGLMMGFDPAKKSFLGLGIEIDDSFIYSKAVKEITSLGKQSFFSEEIDNKPQEFNYMWQTTGESNKEVLSHMFYNNFMRRYSLQNTLKIVVTGHDKRVAGTKIILMWPAQESQNVYNNMYSGEYLIKSVTHYFCPITSPMYRQALVVMKNAYAANNRGDNVSVTGPDYLNFDIGMWG